MCTLFFYNVYQENTSLVFKNGGSLSPQGAYLLMDKSLKRFPVVKIAVSVGFVNPQSFSTISIN